MHRLLKYFYTALILGLVAALVFAIPVTAASFQNFTPSTLKGTVDSLISVDGTGFEADEDFNLKFGSTVIDNLAADPDGNWSYSFNVPEKSAGTYNVVADRAGGLTDVSKSFTVIPKITLSKISGTASTSINITGKGFGGENEIQILFDSTSVKSGITSDSNGSWSSSFTVPAVGSGSHTVTAADTENNEAALSFTTISNASFSINKNSGAAGTSLTINGTGFVAGEGGIVVTYDGIPVGTSTTANTSGSWTLTFSIPASAGGTHTFDASGSVTKSNEVPDRAFSVTPGLILNKNSGPPGTQVTINGAGFAANETGINITWDGSPIGSTASAGPTGSWTATLTIPASSSGVHNINANGPSTPSGGTNIAFTVGAGISTTKTSGPAGTSVAVSGAGFTSGEKSITVTFDGTTVASNITAKADGTWSTSIIVPVSAGGDHSIDATGTNTKATAIQDQIFTTTPSVSIDTTNGSSGSNITISGSGFAPNQKGIAVQFDDQELAGGITANATGSWTATSTVPSAISGNHTIKVAGAGIDELGIGSISFKVKPAASLFPATGTVGTSVLIKGMGFAPNSTLTITYDDMPLNIGKVTSDNLGNFSKNIVIPKSLAGEHLIRISDANNNSSELGFTIEGTAPPVPKLVSPTDGQRIGFMGKITPTFVWEKVTANSPVTYTFQLDSDPEFSNPLEKSELTATKYTLSQTEALPKGNYYWRVKATDAASNESPWPQPQYLKSGLLTPAVFFILLILVIAALGVGVYFMTTRIIRRRRAAAQLAAEPEIVIPEIVNAEYRQLEDKRALPWRLALPQAPQPSKGGKNLSSEDQARLRVIVDFAKSLPLPQPDSGTGWLVEMAENIANSGASPALYSQLLKAEIQIRYEPAWMRHPTFLDLQALLEGQPIMQDLTAYVESVNNTASSAVQVIQEIYRDAIAEITWDLISNNGWGYITGVYTDGVNWFQGKNLREPSDRDYSVKTEGAAGTESAMVGLYGDQSTAFAGLLVKAADEIEAQAARVLHLKLRRNYRNSDKLRDLVNVISQLEIQRSRLLNAFSQFNRLST